MVESRSIFSQEKVIIELTEMGQTIQFAVILSEGNKVSDWKIGKKSLPISVINVFDIFFHVYFFL